MWMSEYETTTTWEELARRVEHASRIVVTTHSKPDGDAIGSTVAMHRALHNKQRAVEVLLMGPVERALRLAAGDTPIRVLEEDGLPDGEPDLIMVLDTGAWSQVHAIEPWLRKHADCVVGLDHHANGDDVASDRIVDTSAASCTQIVLELLDHMNVDIGNGFGSAAEAIFVGLATDTGWFRFSNADARCFATAARLLEHDIDRYRIYRTLEETGSPARMEILQRMLASLEYLDDGHVAVMVLSHEDFTETGGSGTDLTGLVNTPMVVDGVQAAILLSEQTPGTTKISFRSKPALPGDPSSLIDVNRLAGQFGGGGHVHAAGARLEEPVTTVLARLHQAFAHC
jgi:phosphoesterase RecJ-like protein